MADAADTQTQNEAKELPWIATLTRGRSYTLGTTNPIHFTRGEDKSVDDATKRRLEEKAVQMVSTGVTDEDGEVEYEPRCKFVFRKQGEAAPKVEPRRRAREGQRGAVRVHK